MGDMDMDMDMDSGLESNIAIGRIVATDEEGA